MKIHLAIFIIIAQIFSDADAFIVPDEIPSFLSVIYSNIPTIKKGTDSRFGWGFRLGDRADFQVLTELGPQTNTRPLANQEDTSGSGTNKRQSADNLADVLYAQRLREKQTSSRSKKGKENEVGAPQSTESYGDNDGAKWLKNWRQSFEIKAKKPDLSLAKAKPGLALGEIDAKSVIPEDVASVAQV